MVSQHEARRLVRPAVQLDLLDASGGDDLSRRCAREHGRPPGARSSRARRALAEAEAGAADEQGRLAELRALADAFEEVDPQPGEEDDLARERSRLRHLDVLREAAQEAAELLNPDEGPGAVALAGEAAHALGSRARARRRARRARATSSRASPRSCARRRSSCAPT